MQPVKGNFKLICYKVMCNMYTAGTAFPSCIHKINWSQICHGFYMAWSLVAVTVLDTIHIHESIVDGKYNQTCQLLFR